jgi:hypothetical protein
MSATLGGVATQINLETGAITGDAGTIAFGFAPTGSTYTATVRLLGTTGNTQPLTLTLNYPDNTSGTITTDLNTALAGFNADKKTPLSPDISLPVIFAPQVSSATVHAGNRKVELEVQIDAPGITTVQVYGGDYRHFADIAVNSQTGVFRTVINNLEEGDYTFRIYSTDNDGNKSLPVDVQGEAFGENRISQLSNRSITVAILSGSTGTTTISWGDPAENSTGCTLTYTGTDNGSKTITALPDATVTTIDDFKSGLRYSTQFVLGSGNVAEPFSVDEAPQTVFKNIDGKSGWSAEASSYHDNPRQASAAIDGDPWQPWHSSASGQSMPQWIIIDFGAGNALPIDGIVYQARIDDINDRAFPKTVQWESSNDKSTWTTILSSENLEYPTAKPEVGQEKPLWLPCTTKTTARYLRATISATGPISRGYTYIGELGIFEVVE